MAKVITWSFLAQENKKDIFSYWNRRNKSNAYSIKLNELFNAAAELVSMYPEIGRKSEFPGVRIKVVRNYLLIYRIYPDEVYFLTIWDGHKNPGDLERLLSDLE